MCTFVVVFLVVISSSSFISFFLSFSLYLRQLHVINSEQFLLVQLTTGIHVHFDNLPVCRFGNHVQLVRGNGKEEKKRKYKN